MVRAVLPLAAETSFQPEQFAHMVHAIHQRFFNDFYCPCIFGQCLFQICFQIVADALGQTILQPFLQILFLHSSTCSVVVTPDASAFIFSAMAIIRSVASLSRLNKTSSTHLRKSSGMSSYTCSIPAFTMPYPCLWHKHSRGIWSGWPSYGIVASERERQIAHAAAYLGIGRFCLIHSAALMKLTP